MFFLVKNELETNCCILKAKYFLSKLTNFLQYYFWFDPGKKYVQIFAIFEEFERERDVRQWSGSVFFKIEKMLSSCDLRKFFYASKCFSAPLSRSNWNQLKKQAYGWKRKKSPTPSWKMNFEMSDLKNTVWQTSILI